MSWEPYPPKTVQVVGVPARAAMTLDIAELHKAQANALTPTVGDGGQLWPWRRTAPPGSRSIHPRVPAVPRAESGSLSAPSKSLPLPLQDSSTSFFQFPGSLNLLSVCLSVCLQV